MNKRVQPEPRQLEGTVMALVAAAAAIAGWVWSAAELAGWSAWGRWPRLPASGLAAVLTRLPDHLGDPRLAWPPGLRSRLGGPGWFYGWAGLIGGVGGAALAALAWRWRHRGRRGARWAGRADLRPLSSRVAGPQSRLIIGRAGRSGRLLATESRHSVLVLGPTQSGKTSGLAIPAILEWPGAVVATSVKADLAGRTFGWRSARGPGWIFDPTASSGLGPLARWSPLSACATWSDAQRMAGWLVEATPGRRGLADAAFWYSAAAKQLAPLLLAAQRAMLTMADVVRWTDAEEFAEPLRLLELSGDDEAALALAASAGREERIRSSVATTLETVLAPFEDPVVAGSTAATDVMIDELIDRAGTLYLCGPSHEQNRVQGLFAALVSTAVDRAVHRSGEAGGAMDPPLLLVLDEAANIAPIRDLDTLASTAAGLGIQLITVCQDLAQLASRYDQDRARTIANNHRAKVLLSGVADLATLDLISGLAGEQAVREVSITHDLRDGRRTRSVSTVPRRLAPTDELRRIPPGHGVLVYGHLPPVRLRLRPWYLDRRLRRRALTAPP